jgi:hypothetical protein
MRYFFLFISVISMASNWNNLYANEIANPNPGPSEIHVFGDSHSFFCFDKIDGIKVHWLGPRTMHRVGREGLLGLNSITFGVQNNDICIFVFGEIDVRCHVGKQRDIYHRSEDEILKELVQQYVNTIIENRKLFQTLHCVIFAVIPPSDNGYNPDYPFYGTLEERVRLTKTLNQYLKDVARESGIYVLDVYENYATSSGSLNPEMSDGQVHINQNCNGPVKEELAKLLEQIYPKGS